MPEAFRVFIDVPRLHGEVGVVAAGYQRKTTKRKIILLLLLIVAGLFILHIHTGQAQETGASTEYKWCCLLAVKGIGHILLLYAGTYMLSSSQHFLLLRTL